ncbi:MAG: hypothetical protein D9C04_04500 [Nitrosopumilus sp. B06]|nr:MAG: hypothetical protein EB828_00500 [Nitrosopumilus sp. D6]RNJ79478.1 MAG: hypothetical protein D9C04_04500 [Nitrosopumilus sp. B06]
MNERHLTTTLLMTPVVIQASVVVLTLPATNAVHEDEGSISELESVIAQGPGQTIYTSNTWNHMMDTSDTNRSLPSVFVR